MFSGFTYYIKAGNGFKVLNILLALDKVEVEIKLVKGRKMKFGMVFHKMASIKTVKEDGFAL